MSVIAVKNLALLLEIPRLLKVLGSVDPKPMLLTKLMLVQINGTCQLRLAGSTLVVLIVGLGGYFIGIEDPISWFVGTLDTTVGTV